MYERIRAICREKGITISQLEREIDVSRGYISKIDKHRPSLERMERIARYLGVSVSDLTGAGETRTDIAKDVERYYYDPDARAAAQEVYERPGMRVLFSAARGVSEQDLRTVATILERMKATNPDG